MAKVKISKMRIEDALVPVDEQPYKVPENWCWVRLHSIVSVVTGKKDANYGVENGKYTFFTCADEPIKCDGYSFSGESLLLPGNGANVGKVYYFNGDFEAYQRTYVLQEIKKGTICLKYLYYQLMGFWDDYNRDKQYGSATNYIKMGNFTNYVVPLPPFSEQHRIVEKIESLFSKLDEAKEKTMDSVERLDDEYQSILHDAFTGKLTNSYNVSSNNAYSYSEVPLADLVSDIRYGSSEKSDYDNTGTPVLRIPNIENGDITFEDMKYLKGELDNESHEVKENDILIIRSNGSRDLVGKCALVPKLEKRYAYASFLMRIKTNEKVNPRYLSMYINSSMARRQLFVKAKSSSGIHNINSKELGAVKIFIPSIEEQNRIVDIADELLSKIRTAKTISENVCSNIDEVKKSILAKAFRGELGTNNPSEECSIELLKQIV